MKLCYDYVIIESSSVRFQVRLLHLLEHGIREWPGSSLLNFTYPFPKSIAFTFNHVRLNS